MPGGLFCPFKLDESICQLGGAWFNLVLSFEVAIAPAAVSIKLIYPASVTLKSLLLIFLIWRLLKIKKAFQRHRRLGLPGCLFHMKLICIQLHFIQLITAG